MKKYIILYSALLGSIFASRGQSQTPNVTIFDQNNLVEEGAKLTTVGTGYGFTEGPAKDKKGNVYFTDQPNDKIYKWDATTGQISLFLTGTGRSNGMTFDKKGNLIACADMYGEVRKFKKNGTYEVLAKGYNGKLLNGPNDVWINPKTGGMYITDPIFPRAYWETGDPRQQKWEPKKSEQAETGKGGHVYYLAPKSNTLVRVSTMDGWQSDSWPNGVVGTPDGKKLYINQWLGGNKGGTWIFDINADGTLSNMRKFLDVWGDGMALDEKGNLYITNGAGVTAYDPNGNRIFNVPTKGATNCTFAGKDNKTLFITGPTNAVNILKMKVKGSE